MKIKKERCLKLIREGSDGIKKLKICELLENKNNENRTI